jgi:vanillate O-demethylase ferredoxin subunit
MPQSNASHTSVVVDAATSAGSNDCAGENGNTGTELIDVRIARRIEEAEGIISLELVRADAGALPAFRPGAHVDLHVPGAGVRQYSLCNPATETHRYQIAVLLDLASRGGSRAIHDQLNQGDTVRISVPRNHFLLHEDAGHTLLLAGGIGITPLLCMTEQLARQRRSFVLHYCSRSQGRTAFYEALRSGPFAHKVRFHLDDGAPGQQLELERELAACPPDTHLYVCGPKGFMNAVLGQARESGWPESHIHFEYFGAEVIQKPEEEAFEVELASSGKVIRVAPAQSIAAALSAAGIEVTLSCEQGVCGTCLTRVVSGTPDHRDMYLSLAEQEQNDQMLVCCSRSKSARLVLDL